MATTIGGVTLDHDPIWIDKNSYPDQVAIAYTAIDGSEIVMEAGIGAHFPITLEATENTGWLKGAVIDALRSLSKVAGSTYELSYNGESCTVRFRNEVDGGAIQMTYLANTSAPNDDTWYIGKIFLMCIG